jgi:hypothetical protein
MIVSARGRTGSITRPASADAEEFRIPSTTEHRRLLPCAADQAPRPALRQLDGSCEYPVV